MLVSLPPPPEMSFSDSSDTTFKASSDASGDHHSDSPNRKRMRSDSTTIHEGAKPLNRPEALVVEFQNLKRANAFLDVTIKSNTSSFDTVRAHACFLAACSPKLGRILQQVERNAEHEYVLMIDEVPFGAVKKLINFLYTNDLPVRNDGEVREVTEAAKFLEISIPALVLSESNRLECTNTLIGHLGYICALAMTRDGLLVSGSRDNSIRVWDPRSSRPRVELADVHSNRVWALASVQHNGEEKIVSGSWDSTLIVWDPKTWTMEKRLLGHSDWVTCMAVVGKKHFVSGSSDSTLRVWNTTLFEPDRVLRGHRGHIYAVCASADSLSLFSAGMDGFIYVWETKHWRNVQKLKGHPECVVRALAWCDQVNGLVSGASDGRLRIWQFDKQDEEKFVMRQDIEAHTDWVEALCDMSKGRFSSGSRDCTVKIWNAQGSWECLQTIRQHSHWVYALLFERDALISASCDMKIKIWEEEKEMVEDCQQ